jgi:hypothetical protein
LNDVVTALCYGHIKVGGRLVGGQTFQKREKIENCCEHVKTWLTKHAETSWPNMSWLWNFPTALYRDDKKFSMAYRQGTVTGQRLTPLSRLLSVCLFFCFSESFRGEFRSLKNYCPINYELKIFLGSNFRPYMKWWPESTFFQFFFSKKFFFYLSNKCIKRSIWMKYMIYWQYLALSRIFHRNLFSCLGVFPELFLKQILVRKNFLI